MLRLPGATDAQQTAFEAAVKAAQDAVKAGGAKRFVYFVQKTGAVGTTEDMSKIETPHMSILIHA